MESTSNAREHILNRLSEEAQERADARILTDPAYYAELVGEEELLVQEYAAGRLSPSDALAFQEACRRRPDLAQSLSLEKNLPSLLRPAEARRPAPVVTMAPRSANKAVLPLTLAAGLIVGAVAVASYFGVMLNHESKVTARLERELREKEALRQNELAMLEKNRQQPGSIGLRGSARVEPVLRDSAVQQVSVPAGEGWIDLQFDIGSDTHFSSYRAVIQDRDKTIASAEARAIDGGRFRFVSIVVPSTLPADRPLDAYVAGIEPGRTDTIVERYSFRLTLSPSR
jgi:hypothetical protein